MLPVIAAIEVMNFPQFAPGLPTFTVSNPLH